MVDLKQADVLRKHYMNVATDISNWSTELQPAVFELALLQCFCVGVFDCPRCSIGYT